MLNEIQMRRGEKNEENEKKIFRRFTCSPVTILKLLFKWYLKKYTLVTRVKWWTETGRTEMWGNGDAVTSFIFKIVKTGAWRSGATTTRAYFNEASWLRANHISARQVSSIKIYSTKHRGFPRQSNQMRGRGRSAIFIFHGNSWDCECGDPAASTQLFGTTMWAVVLFVLPNQWTSFSFSYPAKALQLSTHACEHTISFDIIKMCIEEKRYETRISSICFFLT